MGKNIRFKNHLESYGARTVTFWVSLDILEIFYFFSTNSRRLLLNSKILYNSLPITDQICTNCHATRTTKSGTICQVFNIFYSTHILVDFIFRIYMFGKNKIARLAVLLLVGVPQARGNYMNNSQMFLVSW